MHKLGKLNSSIDIIPLQGSSGETAKGKVFDRRDPLIISRVYEYLFANENKTFIDVTEIADHLQRKYGDYRTKKKSAFRAMVRRAYSEISEGRAKRPDFSQDPQSQWGEDEDEDVDIEPEPMGDMLNNQLLKMYKKNLGRQNGNSSDKELIDISSDDEQSKSGIASPKSPEEAKYTSKEAKRNPVRSRSSTPKPSMLQAKLGILQASSVETPVSQPTPVTERSIKKRKIDGGTGIGSGILAKKKKEVPVTESKVKFADIGGNVKVLEDVCKLLLHMKHPEVFKQLGISPPRGFLLHGPPGCGKTLVAHAIAGELGVPLVKVAAPELVAGVSGESEARVRELFDQAVALAPCVVFLDEIDAVAPHRATAQREMERRIVAQLLSCLDELGGKENGDRVLVLGATNRPDALDPALRRAGRFDREVSLGIPDREARAGILAVIASKLALAPDVSLSRIAALTPGFVGADLVALIREAAMAAVNRGFGELKKQLAKPEKPVPTESDAADISIEAVSEKDADNNVEPIPETVQNGDSIADSEPRGETSVETRPNVPVQDELESQKLNVAEEMERIQVASKSEVLTDLMSWLHDQSPLSPEYLAGLFIEHKDFEIALTMVQPSAKREGFATVPDVTWDDIGSLQDIREELQMAILAPVRHSEQFAALGLTTATGVLLCGPPGCGKTLLAKAIANEAGINFISVKGPELLNMYVGESEKAVRQCFIRARNSAPCVIFFDELDALCPKRTEGDNSSTSRVVNQMLTEMDGVEGRKGVFLMAASNRPDIIDPAVLRPGRLDKILYVGLPTESDRVDILKALTKNGTKPKLASDVDLEEVGSSSRCSGYTGADLAALVREAGVEALRELMSGSQGPMEVSMRHVNAALDKIRPSVHEKDIRHYEKLRKIYSVKKSPDVTPMETPVDTNLVDTTMEAMET